MHLQSVRPRRLVEWHPFLAVAHHPYHMVVVCEHSLLLLHRFSFMKYLSESGFLDHHFQMASRGGHSFFFKRLFSVSCFTLTLLFQLFLPY